MNDLFEQMETYIEGAAIVICVLAVCWIVIPALWGIWRVI